MSPEERHKLDTHFKEFTKHEVRFLQEYDAEKNEHGAYVYISQSGNSRLALDLFLTSYKQWLIDNNIVTEKL